MRGGHGRGVGEVWLRQYPKTVECIDFKRGTGGVGYLRKMLDVVLLPQIWKLPTNLKEKWL